MSGSDPALETCESSAEFDWSHPEADPSHPRYEPPHLRHRPGDTWQIGGKPFDIDDTGPYGNPLWRPDHRTGRHRRGELPDPLPPETDPEPEPSPPPVTDPRPSPGARRRGFWSEPGQDHHQDDPTDDPRSGDGYRFDRLREDAWDDFMTDSAPLAAAHQPQPVRRSRQAALDREAGLALMMWIRLARWLFALIRSLSTGPEPKSVTAPETRPEQGAGPQETQAAGKRRSRLARSTVPEWQRTSVPARSVGVPSGGAAFPQPGVSYGPDRGESTGAAVSVVTQVGPASHGPDRGEPTGAAVPVVTQVGPASYGPERSRATSPAAPVSIPTRSASSAPNRLVRTSPAARLVAQVRPARATAMARAIAGAQRARAGAASWA